MNYEYIKDEDLLENNNSNKNFPKKEPTSKEYVDIHRKPYRKQESEIGAKQMLFTIAFLAIASFIIWLVLTNTGDINFQISNNMDLSEPPARLEFSDEWKEFDLEENKEELS